MFAMVGAVVILGVFDVLIVITSIIKSIRVYRHITLMWDFKFDTVRYPTPDLAHAVVLPAVARLGRKRR
jgi:hypothetical protein